MPCADPKPRSYRIGSVHFLARWLKRRLNQALVALALVLFAKFVVFKLLF